MAKILVLIVFGECFPAKRIYSTALFEPTVILVV